MRIRWYNCLNLKVSRNRYKNMTQWRSYKSWWRIWTRWLMTSMSNLSITITVKTWISQMTSKTNKMINKLEQLKTNNSSLNRKVKKESGKRLLRECAWRWITRNESWQSLYREWRNRQEPFTRWHCAGSNLTSLNHQTWKRLISKWQWYSMKTICTDISYYLHP